jgi:hypothetical protein
MPQSALGRPKDDCAINPISIAHDLRSVACAIEAFALGTKYCATGCAITSFPKAQQLRSPNRAAREGSAGLVPEHKGVNGERPRESV